MSFYELGFADGGFELGVRTAIEAILASPDFVFRLEEAPSGVKAGESYGVSDTDLASRLSFFLPSDGRFVLQASHFPVPIMLLFGRFFPLTSSVVL